MKLTTRKKSNIEPNVMLKTGKFAQLAGGMLVGEIEIDKLVQRKVRFRRMDTLQRHALSESVARLGFRDAITVIPAKEKNKYEIIDGHHRLDEAKKRDIETIPVVVLTDNKGRIVDKKEADLAMHRFNLSAHIEGSEYLQVIHEMVEDGIPLQDIADATAKEVEALQELTQGYDADFLSGGDSAFNSNTGSEGFEDVDPFGDATPKGENESSRGTPLVLTLPGTKEIEDLLDQAKETFSADTRAQAVVLALRSLFKGD